MNRFWHDWSETRHGRGGSERECARCHLLQRTPTGSLTPFNLARSTRMFGTVDQVARPLFCVPDRFMSSDAQAAVDRAKVR